ncbi:MAG: HNH endonuclease [Fimbriimonadaceae bacterium]
MPLYQDNDKDYRSWMAEHKHTGGYVLNIPADSRSATQNLLFHRADCKKLESWLNKPNSNLTGPNVWKLCETDFDQLVQWAKKERPFTEKWPSPLMCRCLRTADKQEPHPSSLVEDLESLISNEGAVKTSRQSLIEARIGQGVFRYNVLALWENRCSVTGSRTLDAIRASHIKPWRVSSDQERLDPQNGLPLVATLDALFDIGLISFMPDGMMRVSSLLGADECTLLGLPGRLQTRKLPSRTAEFLIYHENKFFRP